MGLIEGIKSFIRRNASSIIYQTSEYYETEKLGNLEIPSSLTDTNAFILANSISEIFFPIDFHADRASKLRFYISKNGKEVKNTELNRIFSELNPLYSFSDLMYQSVFSYLSDGNLIHYIASPDSLGSEVTVNNITRLDVLQPHLVDIREYNNISLLRVGKYNDLIDQIKYQTGSRNEILKKENIRINTIDAQKRDGSNIFCLSPLSKAQKNVNNLLAVLSARYNVYVNNGCAGYLSRKTSPTGNNAQLDAMLNGSQRDEMIADINNRNGITGNRNFWGVSGIPLEFVKTIGTISELQPFEETFEDSIKISSIYQLPSDLVPRPDNSTFENKIEAERSVWENATMSIVDTMCEYFSNNIGLSKIGLQIKADYSTVSCLSQNAITKEDLKAKQIANYSQLYKDGVITLNKYLDAIGELPQIEGNKFIYEVTKTPYAVKLGVGGTQAMQAILTDPTMTSDMKKNTLIVVFGLTVEEATLIIG